MVQLLMGMIYAQRKFLCGNVIAQHQIQLIHIPVFAGNGRNGIVRLSLCFCEYKGRLIGIAAPHLQHMVTQLNEPVAVHTP